MNTIKLNTIGDSPVVVKKGSQVQSQEKTVEITENGTTEVVPDSGFSLSKVTVNTNVESSGSSWRYFDISKCSIEGIERIAHIVKTYRDGGYIGIVSSGALSMAGSSTERIAMGIDMAVGFCSIVDSTEIINYGEHLAPIISDILANGAVEITKEQFYSLSSFVSIRELHQPTSDEVDISAGVINLDNLSIVKEIDVVEPTVYEEDVTPTDIALYSTAKDIAIALMLRYTEDDSLRLVAIVDSTNSSVNTNAYILFSVNTDNTVQYDPDGGIQIVNDILASQDFKYIGEASGGELTEVQFDILDKYIKVKKG